VAVAARLDTLEARSPVLPGHHQGSVVFRIEGDQFVGLDRLACDDCVPVPIDDEEFIGVGERDDAVREDEGLAREDVLAERSMVLDETEGHWVEDEDLQPFGHDDETRVADACSGDPGARAASVPAIRAAPGISGTSVARARSAPEAGSR
jgi:hypothetical protein